MKTNLKNESSVWLRVLVPGICFSLGLLLGALPPAPSGFSWLRVIELSGWALYGSILALCAFPPEADQ